MLIFEAYKVPIADHAGKGRTLSPRVVQAILREELGFDGVILSDDLEMKAVSARLSVAATSLGRPGGATSACQVAASKPG